MLMPTSAISSTTSLSRPFFRTKGAAKQRRKIPTVKKTVPFKHLTTTIRDRLRRVKCSDKKLKSRIVINATDPNNKILKDTLLLPNIQDFRQHAKYSTRSFLLESLLLLFSSKIPLYYLSQKNCYNLIHIDIERKNLSTRKYSFKDCQMKETPSNETLSLTDYVLQMRCNILMSCLLQTLLLWLMKVFQYKGINQLVFCQLIEQTSVVCMNSDAARESWRRESERNRLILT